MLKIFICFITGTKCPYCPIPLDDLSHYVAHRAKDHAEMEDVRKLWLFFPFLPFFLLHYTPITHNDYFSWYYPYPKRNKIIKTSVNIKFQPMILSCANCPKKTAQVHTMLFHWNWVSIFFCIFYKKSKKYKICFLGFPETIYRKICEKKIQKLQKNCERTLKFDYSLAKFALAKKRTVEEKEAKSRQWSDPMILRQCYQFFPTDFWFRNCIEN